MDIDNAYTDVYLDIWRNVRCDHAMRDPQRYVSPPKEMSSVHQPWLRGYPLEAVGQVQENERVASQAAQEPDNSLGVAFRIGLFLCTTMHL